MTLTLFAFAMLPVAFKMVLDPQGMHKTIKDWSSSRGLQFASVLMPIVLCLLIFSTAPISFGWDWDSLLTWLGVFLALCGIGHLFPSLVEWQLKIATESRIPVYGFLALLFALGMVYVDTQLL